MKARSSRPDAVLPARVRDPASTPLFNRRLKNAAITDELRQMGLLVEEPPKKTKGERLFDGAKQIAAGFRAFGRRVREIIDRTDERNAFRAAYGPIPEEVRTKVAIYRE